jgi:vibriolysin
MKKWATGSLVASSMLLGSIGSQAAESVSLHAIEKSKLGINALSLNASLGLSGRDTLVQVSSIKGKDASTVTKMSQFFAGLRVFDHTAVIGANAQGVVTRLHGYVATGIDQDIQSVDAAITPDQAVDFAKSSHKSLYRTPGDWQYRDVSVEKGIFVQKSGKAAVVFHVSFFADQSDVQTPTRPEIMVDAATGKILKYRDSLAFADAEATGPGGNQKTGMYKYGTDFPKLAVTADANNTCQFSTTNVKTIDLQNKGSGNPQNDTDLPTVPHSFQCSENSARPMNGAFSPLNDAHFFGGVVFNMYQSWFGINPLKTDLTLRVHYGDQFENAFWDGKQMTFGDGKDMFYPLVALDVTAHEVSHGFTEFNSHLTYESQSGGINEAFSDIAGEAAEFYMRGQNDFVVGHDVVKNGEALRFMDDPTRDGISIKNVVDFRDPTDEFGCLMCRLSGGGRECADMCGTDPHHSSGIYNKVFYDLAHSPGWDTKKAFAVFVKANQSYWTEQTKFQDGGAALVHAASDLGYSTTELSTALRAVGVSL